MVLRRWEIETEDGGLLIKRSKRQLSKSFTVVIRPLSTRLIKSIALNVDADLGVMDKQTKTTDRTHEFNVFAKVQ